VYYDDLDPRAIDRGIVIFDGNGFGPLWQICRESDLSVVADVHTHPQQSRQSDADRRHPMIAMPGHIALIVPNFAQRVPPVDELGIYEYTGAHQWRDHSGPRGRRFLYIGLWG
jgi:proteasome lid subunit RPN8/RPN11